MKMVVAVLLGLCLAGASLAADLTLYPGAKKATDVMKKIKEAESQEKAAARKELKNLQKRRQKNLEGLKPATEEQKAAPERKPAQTPVKGSKGQTAQAGKQPAGGKHRPAVVAKFRPREEVLKDILAKTETVYTTPAGYAEVYAYYKKLYRETNPSLKKVNEKMPDGKLLNYSFFCLDDARSFLESKHWIKVQHPYIGSVRFKNGKPQYEDVRDLTIITETRKAP